MNEIALLSCFERRNPRTFFFNNASFRASLPFTLSLSHTHSLSLWRSSQEVKKSRRRAILNVSSSRLKNEERSGNESVCLSSKKFLFPSFLVFRSLSRAVFSRLSEKEKVKTATDDDARAPQRTRSFKSKFSHHHHHHQQQQQRIKVSNNVRAHTATQSLPRLCKRVVYVFFLRIIIRITTTRRGDLSCFKR